MGLFDRFKSTKGKDQKAGPKRGVVKGKPENTADKKAFAAVPASQSEAPIVKGQKGQAVTPPAKFSSSTAHLAHAILLRPIVTEKSTRGGAQSQYTFEVHTGSSKADVRRSFHHLYGFTPVSVNMVTLPGKVVRFGRTFGRTGQRKKAIVTLPSGKTIDVVNA